MSDLPDERHVNVLVNADVNIDVRNDYVGEGGDGTDDSLPLEVENPPIEDPELVEIEEDKNKPVIPEDEEDDKPKKEQQP